MILFNHRKLSLAAATLGVLLAGSPLSAQSSGSAYMAAREAGQVGEQTDGYLGFPASPSAEVRRTADDVNIKRRAIYAQRAEVNHSTIEDYAFTTACRLILKTKPGEMYMAPDGSWKKRSAGAPLRDSRCPASEAGPN